MKDVMAIVFAKRPEPGRVKTRLQAAAGIDAAVADRLGAAMLHCTNDRLLE